MNLKIVVPLDGSELAERALRYAKTPAAKIGAAVTLLHVCGPDDCNCEAEKCTVQPMQRVYVEHAAQLLKNELLAVAADNIHIDWEVLVGDPATEIMNYARERHFDRIIMASHGRSGVSRWILGSVTDKVTRESHVPVVIIRADAEETERSELPDRKVLVLLDGSDMSEKVLPYAIQHAKISDREILLLHVCELPNIESPASYYLTPRRYPPAEPVKWEDFAEQELGKSKDKAQEYLKGIEIKIMHEGLGVKSQILIGKPAEKIIDYVSKNPFNLIAMSTHGRSGLSRWAYGSVADRILHTVSTPLLLVRPASSE